MKELIGRIFCFFGFHNEKRDRAHPYLEKDTVADGFYCIRKNCNWKMRPISWPEPAGF